MEYLVHKFVRVLQGQSHLQLPSFYLSKNRLACHFRIKHHRSHLDLEIYIQLPGLDLDSSIVSFLYCFSHQHYWL